MGLLPAQVVFASSLSDPLARELYSIVGRFPDDIAARIAGYLRVQAVFGADLAGNVRLQEQLHFWFVELQTTSVWSALEQIPRD